MGRRVGVAVAVILGVFTISLLTFGNHGLAGSALVVAFALAFLSIAIYLAVGLLRVLVSREEE